MHEIGFVHDEVQQPVKVSAGPNHGSAECGPKQVRADGCQLGSGRGSRAYTSSERRPNTGRWPTSSSIESPTIHHPEAVGLPATLKVGGGSGGWNPPGCGGLGAEAAKPPEPPSLLDYTKHNCNREQQAEAKRNSRACNQLGRHCGHWTVVGPHENGKSQYVRFRCKGYDCSICGPRKIRRVRRAIVQYAIDHNLQRFLTLTLDPKKLPPELALIEMIAYLRDSWRKMRVYIQRKLGRSLVFISVVELHQSGVPHLHVLVGSYLPQRWVSIAWQAAGGGRIVDGRHVDIHRVAAYLAKYITKEKLCSGFTKTFGKNGKRQRLRRFTTSRGLALFERTKPGSGWILTRVPIERLSYDLLWRGVGREIEEYETEEDGSVVLSWFVADMLSPMALLYRVGHDTPRYWRLRRRPGAITPDQVWRWILQKEWIAGAKA